MVDRAAIAWEANRPLEIEEVDLEGPKSGDGCRRFHTDNVRHRLVCTYRGPGTDRIDPKAAANAASGIAIDSKNICQLERGDVALMRGGRDATGDRPGLVHRSPRIEGTEIVRLLLIEADDEWRALR